MIDPTRVPATLEELIELVESTTAFIEKTLKDNKTDSWMPMLHLRCRTMEGKVENILCALAIDFNEDDVKQNIMFAIGKSIYEKKLVPIGAVFSSEAWQLMMEPGDEYVRPSESPNRKEIITAVASSLGGKNVTGAFMPIVRDADNNIVPGEFCKPISEGMEANLLQHLWRGFFSEVISKLGEMKGE